MRDSLPPSITIRSDDMPDPILPAFFRHVPVEAVIDSRSWGADDPEALRERGPRAVGEALIRMRGAWSGCATTVQGSFSFPFALPLAGPRPAGRCGPRPAAGEGRRRGITSTEGGEDPPLPP